MRSLPAFHAARTPAQSRWNAASMTAAHESTKSFRYSSSLPMNAAVTCTPTRKAMNATSITLSEFLKSSKSESGSVPNMSLIAARKLPTASVMNSQSALTDCVTESNTEPNASIAIRNTLTVAGPCSPKNCASFVKLGMTASPTTLNDASNTSCSSCRAERYALV